MSFSRFARKSVGFVRKSFNALVGSAVSTVTAAVVTGLSAIAFPVVLLGGSIAAGLWIAERALRHGYSKGGISAAGVLSGLLAPIPISLAVGLAVVVGNLVSPFLGLVRGFKNGFVAALIPSILYYTVYDRHRERERLRNQQEYQRRVAELQQRHPERRAQALQPQPDAVPLWAVAQPDAPVQRARWAPVINVDHHVNQAVVGLRRYVNEPQAANDDLVAKISELKPLPGTTFELLSAAEMKILVEEKGGPVPALLSQYQARLAIVNAAHSGCSISLSSLEEMKPCLTVEFKQGGAWHHYNYDADTFLLHVRSGQRDRLASLPENRKEIDGRVLELVEENGSLQQAESFKIYKGFHAEVLASLKAEVKPALDQLRAILRQKQERPANGSSSPRLWQPDRREGQPLASALLPQGDQATGVPLRRVQ